MMGRTILVAGPMAVLLAFRPGPAQSGSTVTVTDARGLAEVYPAGTTILIPAGTVINGPVVMRAVGSADEPIVVRPSGKGPPPRITGAAAAYADALTVGSHTVIDGLLITDTNRYGVAAPKDTVGVTVQNSEITRVGIGVGLLGSQGRVLNNVIHDLTMVKVTPKSVQPDDDYGANGVLVAGTGHEVAHNRFLRNAAPSDDYGEDGGCIELFGSVSELRVHHNWCADSVGFMELGGRKGDVIQNVDIAFNVVLNLHDKPFFNPHNGGGQFAVGFNRVSVRRNTIVATVAGSKAMGIFYLDADPAPDAFSIADNIVSLNSGDSVFKREGGYHTGNVFHLQDKATHLFNNWSMTLGPGESYADPRFADPGSEKFELTPGSRATGKGAY
ncbi:hypothetical protein ASF49_12615 [Methylobacterium sp. Leaf104]|uniref:hypothetical protein n=1 Tax=Methylobacterium TaxID=407 RepID=UPI0006F45110|nr:MULTISPECIES: hypothetical protein [Methylobacterium]KQP30811.1 hypothetical protein ASF49_12615 [Methylobacterium sp. Leaf104]MCI9882198.1 hypothetical protein [Methylobacterium goesingense]